MKTYSFALFALFFTACAGDNSHEELHPPDPEVFVAHARAPSPGAHAVSTDTFSPLSLEPTVSVSDDPILVPPDLWLGEPTDVIEVDVEPPEPRIPLLFADRDCDTDPDLSGFPVRAYEADQPTSWTTECVYEHYFEGDPSRIDSCPYNYQCDGFTDVFFVPSEVELIEGYTLEFRTRFFSNDEVATQRRVIGDKPVFVRLKTANLCNRSFGAWVSLVDAGGEYVETGLEELFTVYVEDLLLDIYLEEIPPTMGPDRPTVGFQIQPVNDLCPDPDDIGFCDVDGDCLDDKWDRPHCVDDTDTTISRSDHGRLCQVCTPDEQVVYEVFDETLQRWIYPSADVGCSLEAPYCLPGGTDSRRDYYLHYEWACTDEPMPGFRSR